MARVPPLPEADCPPAASAHGRATNMKRTLSRVPAALEAYMHWYGLHAEIVPFLGARAAMVFAHAVSSQADCLICSTFFRRWLTDAGENPDALSLDGREQALVDYGRQLARDANAVSDDLFARLRGWFDERQLVALTAFGGLMIATNVFNNALKVDLDEYLFPYRKAER